MLLGALIDLGLSTEWLRGLPRRLGVPQVEIRIADVMRCGLRSTKVDVTLDGATEGPADVLDHDHGPEAGDHQQHQHRHSHSHGHGTGHHHDHGAGHSHRHVGALLGMIAAADLTPAVKEKATAAFRLLAEAEGRVHGVEPEAVMLHEVGAYDALVDIVGVVEGFEQLGVEAIYRRPLALGSGWVRAAHGVMPVPAPATAILVEGLAIGPDGPVEGEATTPTGAALLRVLASGPVPAAAWRSLRTGFGAGGRNPGSYANTLRIVLAEFAEAPAEAMVVLATDLDDFTPEYLEPLREALVTAGAVDVQTWPTQMKKGRIGFRVEALVAPEQADQVVTAFFRHSTTAGVRRAAVSRTVLPREEWTALTDSGEPVRVKTLLGPDGPQAKPEYDDVIEIARRTGQPAHQVFRTLQQQAQREVRGTPATGRPEFVNPKESLR